MKNDQCFHIMWFIWKFQKIYAANREGSFNHGGGVLVITEIRYISKRYSQKPEAVTNVLTCVVNILVVI